MAIAFLVDENIPRAVSHAIIRHNRKGLYLIDAIQIGMVGAPGKGIADPDLLLWSEQHARILVSYDKKTLPDHFAAHLATGHHSPGVFFFKLRHSIPHIVEFLSIVAHASDPREWRDRLFYVD
jgi:hypothetical protein